MNSPTAQHGDSMRAPQGRAPQGSAVFVDSIVLAVLIAAMCTQINVLALGQDTYKSEGFATKQLFVALSDVVLLLAFAWFVVRTTVLRAWKRVWWPPLPVWALIAAMILAMLHSQSIVNAIATALGSAHGPKGLIKALVVKESKEAIAEIVQFTAYFIFAPLLFVNLMHDRREGELIVRRHLALSTFAVAVFYSALLGLLQLATSAGAPTAFFGSPNIYAAFLAISLPLLVARLLHDWRRFSPTLAIIALAVFMGIITSVSVFAAGALLLGIIVAGLLQQVPNRMVLVLGLSSALTFIAWNQSGKLAPYRAEYLRVNSKSQLVKKQYVEWYAALGWSDPRQRAAGANAEPLRAFATGVGPGNYQLNIGPYYSSLPNEEKMPPDSNNLYLVQTVSLGILGFGALLWVLGYFAKQASLARLRFPIDWLGPGVLASLAAFLAVNFFHATIVRGVGLVLTFMLSLAIIAAQREEFGTDIAPEK